MCRSLHNATPVREGRPAARGRRSKTAGEGNHNNQIISLMHPLRQRPHWVDSSLFAREPFQNQESSRHQRILIGVILSVAGVPGAPESPYDPGEALKSVPWRLRSPAPPQACAQTTPLPPHEVRPVTASALNQPAHPHTFRNADFSHPVFGTDNLNSAIIMVNLFIVGFIRKTCITGNFCCVILVKPEMIISSRKTNLCR